MATRKKHTPAQVVRKRATADRMLGNGKDVADVVSGAAGSEQTYYRWRNQFGWLKADDAKQLKTTPSSSTSGGPPCPTRPPVALRLPPCSPF